MNEISKDEIFKEIDLIQSCINRMAKNSFSVKGWALTLFIGALALLNGNIFTNPWLVIIVVVMPYIAFWYLDTYFLRIEKCYRFLYKWVITKRIEGDTTLLYDLDPSRFKDKSGSFWKTFFSQTLLVFFGIPSLIITIICVISIVQQS